MMFWYGNAGWAFWQIAVMWVFMIAFWGLLIWAVCALITNLARKPGKGHTGDGARRILDERLARGEIDTDEYRRLRDAMAEQGSRGKTPGQERIAAHHGQPRASTRVSGRSPEPRRTAAGTSGTA
jgi:putative membrane protein